MKKFNLVLAGGVVVAIALMFVFTNARKATNNNLLGKQQITYTGQRTFGSLATLTSASRSQSGGGGPTSAVAPNESATAPVADTKMAFGMGGGGVASPDSLIYRPVNYTFAYKGDPITVDAGTSRVFERVKGFGGSVNLQSFLSGFNLGTFDISKFGNANLDYVTASQDQDFGYQLSLDMKQGTVNIGENWEKWMTPDRQCTDDACYQQNKMTIDQVPPDSDVIAIANSFLDEYGIDKSQFGDPVIQDQWRIQYDAAVKSNADSSFVYIPDTQSVIYPTKIDGKEVYDEGGNKAGMYVTVNLRVKKVSYISELTGQNYNASDYETEQDTDKIIKIAENGGYRSYPMYADTNAKTLELELGTPTQALVHMWQTLDNVSRDIYVPSLIFPVMNPTDNVYVKNVEVPLVKEILDSPQIVPPIMPLDKGVPTPMVEPAAPLGSPGTKSSVK